MKFGLFYEMFVPLDELDEEARIVRHTVDQIVHADRLGWDYVWLTEHHFLGGFSHMSAPEVVFGAAAYQTEHIRFGFGLSLTPPSYNHPVRIAERVAMLDCLSGGRVDLGSGRSTTPAELYGFGIDPEESRAQWAEGLEVVTRLLAEEEVEFEGSFVKLPKRTVYPRPVQKPHPPLWVGGVGPGNAERAAQQGLGMLFFAPGPESIRTSVEAYRAHIGDAKPICGAVNNATAGFVNGLCGHDRDEVRRIAASRTVEHNRNGSRHMITGWPESGPTPSYAHVMAEDGAKGTFAATTSAPDVVAEGLLKSGFVMAGNADDCRPVLDSFRDVGVDQIIIHMQMGNVPHERIMESIEIIGKELIPEYR